MGEKVPDRVEFVQFHQSYSYEDFIQGYRPSEIGFALRNGIFHQFCRRAAEDEANPYVFIIDEINRGNLSKIFGELMMLIEAEKRGRDSAIPLTYSAHPDERFYVPENVFLIGMMNTADRSLAMVDYALRRRFAFITLEPRFGDRRFSAYLENAGATDEVIDLINERMAGLNEKICGDVTNLGPGFAIGHSYFCIAGDGVRLDVDRYRRIIDTEIAPLIREYWFDDESAAKSRVDELLKDLPAS